jgi:hypothetical protein
MKKEQLTNILVTITIALLGWMLRMQYQVHGHISVLQSRGTIESDRLARIESGLALRDTHMMRIEVRLTRIEDQLDKNRGRN